MGISELYGNTSGLKRNHHHALEALYHFSTDFGLDPDHFILPRLAIQMAELARLLNRQIGAMVDRRGRITHIIVGDAHRLFIPDLTRHRAGSSRFRGLRLLHTHLRGEGLTRDDLTDLTLLRLDMILAFQVDLNGKPGALEYATLNPAVDQKDNQPWTKTSHRSLRDCPRNFVQFIEDLEAQYTKRKKLQRIQDKEGAILIGVTTGPQSLARASLAELERLSHTSGLQVMDTVLQRRKALDGRFVIGKGRLQEVVIRAMQLDCEVLIFDHELSPSQLRNIATETELKVIDRSQLILDIFAQRARTREGKLQVELAQLRYRLPRLKLMPTAMSRLTGGIGGRGPGETKLEINRRRADERLTRLERNLKKLAKGRALRRGKRKRAGIPQVALVGYTNAGKSTLLNRMTNADVDAEDKLFATLDPTSRRLRFPKEHEVILTDTVGFIRNLPKELMEAFRSTFEETLESHLILHVVDAADPERDLHMDEVIKTLGLLNAGDIPRMVVLNKIDSLTSNERNDISYPDGWVICSAITGEGIEELILEMEQRLFKSNRMCI